MEAKLDFESLGRKHYLKDVICNPNLLKNIILNDNLVNQEMKYLLDLKNSGFDKISEEIVYPGDFWAIFEKIFSFPRQKILAHISQECLIGLEDNLL